MNDHSASATTTPDDQRLCWCGCGAAVGARSFYRPGHDSRHVGIVARQVVASEAFNTITNQLPTVALQFKAWNMAYRLHAAELKTQAREAKAEAKAKRQARPAH